MRDQTKCADCGGPVTVDRNAVRRYVIGGLPHVELHGVEVTTCGACGVEDITIPRITQLHRALAHAFVMQPRMLAPVEIRFVRTQMGLSTEDFASVMGVARETVSRWETGKQPMGAVADRLLRTIALSHEPPDNYVVEDFLKSLDDSAAPDPLPRVAMNNTKGSGWTAGDRTPMALA